LLGTSPEADGQRAPTVGRSASPSRFLKADVRSGSCTCESIWDGLLKWDLGFSQHNRPLQASLAVAFSVLALADLPRIRPVLGKITDKWAVMILTVLCPKPARFNELKRRLEGLTHKALADALKRLERNGLVPRTVLATAPVAVEYHITSLGISLREPFEVLCRWAATHGDNVERAAGRYDEAKARQGKASRGEARRGEARQGKARQAA